jgi:hypothetical protein
MEASFEAASGTTASMVEDSTPVQMGR